MFCSTLGISVIDVYLFVKPQTVMSWVAEAEKNEVMVIDWVYSGLMQVNYTCVLEVMV